MHDVASQTAPAAMHAPPRGMSAARAANRLLTLAGRAESIPDMPGDPDVERLLDAVGFAVQALDLERARLSNLPAPALMELAPGDYLVLRGTGLRWCEVEGQDGRARVRTRALQGLGARRAIVAAPGLPPGETVGTRFGKLMLSRRRPFASMLCAALLVPGLTIAIADLSSRVAGRALPDEARGMLGLLAATVLVASVMATALTWFRDRAALAIATWVELSAKRGYLSHALALPFAWLQTRSLGQLLQGIAGLSSARVLVLDRIAGAALDGLALVLYVVAMALRLWPAALGLLVASVAMVGIVLALGLIQARIQAREVVAQAGQRGYLAELISGVRTLKAAGAESICESEWARRYDVELRLALRRQRVGLPAQVVMDAARHGFPAAMLVWGGHAVLEGELDLGSLVAFILLGVAFVQSLNSLLGALLAAIVAWPQLQPMLEVMRGQVDAPTTTLRISEAVTLRANGLWFRHAPDADWILRDFELELGPGQVHRLGGASGSGKTTLLRLLAGLYAPQKGSVSIGGFPAGRVAGQVLYLPQVVQLASGTIMDNLQMFSNNASHDRLLKQATRTGFDEVVNQLPLRYETPLTRGGATLSGGQRQLLALTAALASTAGIFLLDEPMANLDPQTAAQVRALLGGDERIVVIAEHG